MNRVMASLLGLLNAAWLLGGIAVAAPADSPPGQLGYHFYGLKLVDGLLVLSNYKIGSLTLRPVLDTGSTFLALSLKAYSALHVCDETTGRVTSYGRVAEEQLVAMLEAPVLGSGRSRWFYVLKTDQFAGQDFDSVVPLDVLDADYVTVLISRGEAWLTDLRPHAFDGLIENDAIKQIPYFTSGSMMYVAITCQGKQYMGMIDSAADTTQFTSNFVAGLPNLFYATGESQEYEGIGSTKILSPRVYHLDPGICIEGSTPQDDIPLGGDYLAYPAMSFSGGRVAKTELGDPSMMPYRRADAPTAAPVVLIGMDVLCQYDFLIDRRFNKIYFWPPSETPKLFPAASAQYTSGEHDRD